MDLGRAKVILVHSGTERRIRVVSYCSCLNEQQVEVWPLTRRESLWVQQVMKIFRTNSVLKIVVQTRLKRRDECTEKRLCLEHVVFVGVRRRGRPWCLFNCREFYFLMVCERFVGESFLPNVVNKNKFALFRMLWDVHCHLMSKSCRFETLFKCICALHGCRVFSSSSFVRWCRRCVLQP